MTAHLPSALSRLTTLTSLADRATIGRAAVSASIPVSASPWGVAVTPDGRKAYVACQPTNTVSVVDTLTRTVVRNPLTFGILPIGVAMSPDGAAVYVTTEARRPSRCWIRRPTR